MSSCAWGSRAAIASAAPCSTEGGHCWRRGAGPSADTMQRRKSVCRAALDSGGEIQQIGADGKPEREGTTAPPQARTPRRHPPRRCADRLSRTRTRPLRRNWGTQPSLPRAGRTSSRADRAAWRCRAPMPSAKTRSSARPSLTAISCERTLNRAGRFAPLPDIQHLAGRQRAHRGSPRRHGEAGLGRFGDAGVALPALVLQLEGLIATAFALASSAGSGWYSETQQRWML